MVNKQDNQENESIARLELYRLIGDGYKAMWEGRTRSIQEVKQKLEKNRMGLD